MKLHAAAGGVPRVIGHADLTASQGPGACSLSREPVEAVLDDGDIQTEGG